MARAPRIQIPGGNYHVTARGNERRAIFRDDRDRGEFLAVLAAVVRERAWQLIAYCLMDNHYHLLVRTRDADLAGGMHYLNAVYAQRFNRSHRRVGHLFQGRYHAVLVQENAHLLAAARYIVRNPVRAGIRSRPEDWRWSSHRAVLRRSRDDLLDSRLLLDLFAPDPARARKLYEEYVASPAPRDGEAHPLVEGDDDYVRRHLALVVPSPEHPRSVLRPVPAPLAEILARPATPEQLAHAQAQGHTLTAIAAHLGVAKSTVSRRLRAHATFET